ncbi:MFS transporter [Cytobacillus purgationiresistens]|uniref:MFS family permease n=1 Tax=Cytobacillus purgationiresistens TaxID=863449 RepID=A0ABU0AL29_9BACI|nr:MFS transporter [Cytobacillus purgationiresistens]MDQ0271594.1 MFS family permease [Cytobacillus purgationiresistens]
MGKFKQLLAANLVSMVGTGISSYLIIWLLIDQLRQSVLYGYLTIFVMILLIVLAPYLGSLIDHHSRKLIFYYLELSGAILLVAFIALYSLDIKSIQILLLTMLIIYQHLYDSIKYPILAALTQEMFKKEQYNKVNSSLEVQGQTAAMVSTAIAAFSVGTISIYIIIIINIVTHLTSAFLIFTMPHDTKNVHQVKKEKSHFIHDFMESMNYLRELPLFISIILMVSFSPAIAVIVMNYIEPIFVYHYLNGGPEIIGAANLLYAVGAIVGGVVSLFFSKRLTPAKALFTFMLIFTVATVAVFVVPSFMMLFVASTLWGVSNAASRIFRKDFMLNHIDNRYMGRVNTSFNSLKLLVQSILIFIITSIFVSNDQILSSYLTLVILTLVSSIVLIIGSLTERNLIKVT